MLISHRHRFIFIHVPKNAGLSISAALAPYADNAPMTQMRRFLSLLPLREDPRKAFFRHHATAAWVKLKLPAEIFDGYLKFAVVRNPYDRVISYYHYLTQNTAHHRYDQVKGLSFRQYLDYDAERLGKGRTDTQLACVADKSGHILVDRILHFETLKADFADLCSTLDLPAPALPVENASKRPKSADPYADEESRAHVARLYAQDFETFGYSLDPATRTAVP